jgi:hypothetical protein
MRTENFYHKHGFNQTEMLHDTFSTPVLTFIIIDYELLIILAQQRIRLEPSRLQLPQVIKVWQVVRADGCEIERARVQAWLEWFRLGLVGFTFASPRDAFFNRIA